MYYFKVKENVVEKYLVNFSKEEIEELRALIINRCSEIVHREYTGCKGPNQFDYLRIRNYKQKYVGLKEARDYYSPDREMYQFSYDEYQYPYLVDVIDRLLKGSENAIATILEDSFESKEKSIPERIKKASEELDAIDNLDINKKRAKLDELQELLKLQKLNENQEPIGPYHEKLKDLISLELVDKITTEEIERVENFFEKGKILSKKI